MHSSPTHNGRGRIEVAQNTNRISSVSDQQVLQTLQLTTPRRFGRVLLIVSALALAVGGVATWRIFYKPQEPVYKTQKTQQGDLVVTVTATGSLEPTNHVDIGCEISGTVRSVEVDYNDSVNVGDLLLTFKTDELQALADKSQATLDVRKAEVMQAEATLLEAEQVLSRLHKLRQNRAASAQDLEAAKANLARAKAKLESAKAQVAVAEATLHGDLSKLEKTKVYSPINGIVLTRNVEPGQTIAATFQAPVLLTICEDLRRMKLKVDVDEADVGNIREGQNAHFTVDAFPDQQFPAQITSLRFASQRTQDVVTYEAVLDVDNPQRWLRPGMTAVADIVTSQIPNAVLIPNAALRFTPDVDPPTSLIDQPTPQGSRVWTLADEGMQPVEIETGRTDGRFTELVSGEVVPGMPLLVDLAQ